MAESETTAFILRDEAGAYYAIPPEALATFRVPDEHRETVARIAGEAGADDTAGFGHGHGQGQGQGQGLGRGHGSGNPHTLLPVLPAPLPLPFPTITDGTSNTIFFGER